MSNIDKRLKRDLRQIADQATLSSTAWHAIQRQIETETDPPDMEVIMLVPNPKKWHERPSFRPGALAGAAAVILLIVGIVVATSRNDSNPVASGTPLDLAEAYMDARDSWDGVATRALFSDDAIIEDLAETAEDYLQVTGFHRAIGFRFNPVHCAEKVPGPEAEVTCTYTFGTAWDRALGVGPFSGSSFDFVIANGLIQRLASSFETDTGFSSQAWGVFRAWVRTNHPDDFSSMYDISDPLIDFPHMTPEAIALWERHTAEFVASTEG